MRFVRLNKCERIAHPRLGASWAAAKPLPRRVGLCKDQSASGRAFFVPTVAIPSEQIARQWRFVRGHARILLQLCKSPDTLRMRVSQPPPDSSVGPVEPRFLKRSIGWVQALMPIHQGKVPVAKSWVVLYFFAKHLPCWYLGVFHALCSFILFLYLFFHF